MRWIFLLFLTVSLSGCLADVLVTTATQGKLQADQATAAQNTLDRVKNDTGLMNLQRTVDTYRADTGHYPESLDVLGFNPLPKRGDGGNFGYNPVTGEVLETDAGPTAADYLLMEDIGAAINAYGTAAGYYPPTLDTLAESGYLPELPRTEFGQEFAYNNQNGVFTHPLEGHVNAARQAPAQNRGGAAAGGGGPLGEAMTGIAIQEELNGSSNAGASRARGTGATGINRATNTQNDRQQKALEDLGF